jgi:hypothetical protein
MNLKELSDAEQREARILAALDDWKEAEENYERVMAQAPRDRFLAGLAVGLLIGGALLLGIWLTQI